jgi:twitching motility protein PilT
MSLLDVAPIIEQMLLISDNVSDLNFSTGQKPQIEISGTLYSVSPMGLGKLTSFQTEMMAMAILRDNPEASAQLAKYGTADLSYSIPGKSRFRVNIFQQRGSLSIVMRVFLTEFRLSIRLTFRRSLPKSAICAPDWFWLRVRPVRGKARRLPPYRPHQ